MAAAVFVGAPARDEIKRKMDRALDLFAMPQTQENYSRCGSVLVRLRKDSGVSEMDLLGFAIRLREETPTLSMELPDALALGAATLTRR